MVFISAEPYQLDNQIAHECQQYNDDEIDYAARFGDNFGSFIYPFLVLLQFSVIVFDLVQVYQHLCMESVKRATDRHCVGVDYANTVKKIVHALLDHCIDLFQRLKHLSLFKSRSVFFFQKAVNRQIISFEFVQRTIFVIVDIFLQLGHFLTLAAHQFEVVLLKGVNHQFFILQLLLERAHLFFIYQLVLQRVPFFVPAAFPLHFFIELQHQCGHLFESLLHAIFALHQFEQSQSALLLVTLHFDTSVCQLVCASVYHEILPQFLEFIELERWRFHLFYVGREVHQPKKRSISCRRSFMHRNYLNLLRPSYRNLRSFRPIINLYTAI